MKRQIRQGCFETNSSSVHAICISYSAMDNVADIPLKMNFKFGNFGWSRQTLSTIESRASYLYTAIVGCTPKLSDCSQMMERLNFVYQTLRKHGVERIDFEPMEIHIFTYKDDMSFYVECPDYNNIDHVGECESFVEHVCTDEDALLAFLFNPQSYVETGNDNEDYEPYIDVDYPHEEFYKYN